MLKKDSLYCSSRYKGHKYVRHTCNFKKQHKFCRLCLKSRIAPHGISIPRPALEVALKRLSHLKDALEMFHAQFLTLVNGECLGCAHSILNLRAKCCQHKLDTQTKRQTCRPFKRCLAKSS